LLQPVAIGSAAACFFQFSSGRNSRIHIWYKREESVYRNPYKPCTAEQLVLGSHVYVA
jgi:hypothetical protein